MSRQSGELTVASAFRYLRNLAGVLYFDWMRYRHALRAVDAGYLALCNRGESLERSPDGKGFRCNWQWTSDLHAPKYLSGLGLCLMKRALADHRIIRRVSPIKNSIRPDICFIIGHRGLDRLPHLLATLESIAGQADVVIECIVVEQDVDSKLVGKLPDWVQHVHTPPPDPDMPYCRSWTFNVGARHASADILVLHDNDMLISADYSAQILEKVRNDFEVVNLKRFIFYLNERHSALVFKDLAELEKHAPESILQNSEGGGSIAITKKAYESIGGFDESFIGWGGEDNEFWERAHGLKLWTYAYLPLVHLWHAAQPGKQQSDSQTLRHYRALSAIPVKSRIKALCSLKSGQASGPVGWKTPG